MGDHARREATMWSNAVRGGAALILSVGLLSWTGAQPAQGCGGKTGMQTRTPQSTTPANSPQATAAQQSALLRMVQQTSALVAAAEQPSASSKVTVSASFASTSSSLSVAQQQENLVTGLENMLKRQHGQLKPYQIHAVRQREISIRKQLGKAGQN
jgi:hypothetical protein